MIFNVVSFFPSRVILYGLWSGLVVCFFVGGVWSSRSFTYWYSSKSAFAFSSPIAFSRPMFLFSFWNGCETSLARFSFSSPLTDLLLCSLQGNTYS